MGFQCLHRQYKWATIASKTPKTEQKYCIEGYVCNEAITKRQLCYDNASVIAFLV